MHRYRRTGETGTQTGRFPLPSWNAGKGLEGDLCNLGLASGLHPRGGEENLQVCPLTSPFMKESSDQLGFEVQGVDK